MSLTTKSPRKVILAALKVGTDALPLYAHRFSPKTYTQPQLFACLVLQAFLRLDYRGTEQLLTDFPGIAAAIGLTRAPDHSTLHKAAARLLGARPSDALLTATVQLYMRPRRRRRLKRVALDSSGFESRHVSAYFVRRRTRGSRHAEKQGKHPLYQTTVYHRFPKLATVCDTQSHLILAAICGAGPSPDHDHFAPALDQAARRMSFHTLLADAGYDGEHHHVYARHEHGLRTLIPPTIGRPTRKPPAGHYRRLMQRFMRSKRTRKRSGYTQRWQNETVFSMIKRNLTCELTARSHWPRCREMMLLVITHNVMILWIVRFSTEQTCPVFFLQPNKSS